MGQVLKFAAQKNEKVLRGYYLYDLTTVDGPSCFPNLKPRTDLTVDFRTATMRRNPDLKQSLPSSMREELHQRDDYILVSTEIENLASRIDAAEDEEESDQLKVERKAAYKRRRKLEDDKLKKYRKTTKRVHPDRRKLQQGEKYRVDLYRTHFDRIRHMTPERDRLARTLFLPA